MKPLFLKRSGPPPDFSPWLNRNLFRYREKNVFVSPPVMFLPFFDGFQRENHVFRMMKTYQKRQHCHIRHGKRPISSEMLFMVSHTGLMVSCENERFLGVSCSHCLFTVSSHEDNYIIGVSYVSRNSYPISQPLTGGQFGGFDHGSVRWSRTGPHNPYNPFCGFSHFLPFLHLSAIYS